MRTCTFNRHRTATCLGRPRHPCLPNRRESRPPPSPSMVASWSPFAGGLAWCVGCVYEAPAPGPAQGVLPKRPCGLAQAAVAEPILPGSRAWTAAQLTHRCPQTPAALRKTTRLGEARPGAWHSPVTPPALPGEREGRGGGQGDHVYSLLSQPRVLLISTAPTRSTRRYRNADTDSKPQNRPAPRQKWPLAQDLPVQGGASANVCLVPSAVLGVGELRPACGWIALQAAVSLPGEGCNGGQETVPGAPERGGPTHGTWLGHRAS